MDEENGHNTQARSRPGGHIEWPSVINSVLINAKHVLWYHSLHINQLLTQILPLKTTSSVSELFLFPRWLTDCPLHLLLLGSSNIQMLLSPLKLDPGEDVLHSPRKVIVVVTNMHFYLLLRFVNLNIAPIQGNCCKRHRIVLLLRPQTTRTASDYVEKERYRQVSQSVAGSGIFWPPDRGLDGVGKSTNITRMSSVLLLLADTQTMDYFRAGDIQVPRSRISREQTELLSCLWPYHKN